MNGIAMTTPLKTNAVDHSIDHWIRKFPNSAVPALLDSRLRGPRSPHEVGKPASRGDQRKR